MRAALRSKIAARPCKRRGGRALRCSASRSTPARNPIFPRCSVAAATSSSATSAACRRRCPRSTGNWSADGRRAVKSRVLSFLLNTGLFGVMARLGLMEGALDQLSRQNLTYTPFTQLANLTGTPAMSVPLHWAADGLPLGVQFIGPFGSEAMLLQLAGHLERVEPWMQRLPDLAFLP